jgi:hypothetical protein
MHFSEIMYRRLNRDMNVSDYIAWANHLLEQGCDLPEIAEMASFAFESEPDAKEVERYFLRCVQLLGFSMSDDVFQATIDYWGDTCERMLDGRLALDEGIALLHEIDNDYEYYLMMPWVDLARYHTEKHRQTGQCQFAADDIASYGEEPFAWMLVRQFLTLCQQGSQSFPTKFPVIWYCLACNCSSNEDTWTTQRTAPCRACGSADSLKNMQYYVNREAYLQQLSPQSLL